MLIIQLIVEDKKKAVTMSNTWDPGSTAIKTETEELLALAVKDGIINMLHLKDLQKGTMITDRFVGLQTTILHRRNKVAK